MFLRHVHSFRGLAILFIVAGHVLHKTTQLTDWQQHRGLVIALNVILANGTVLFVFIAGFLFQHLSHRYSYRPYLKNKLTNVILPYMILSVPAIVITLRGIGTGFDPFAEYSAWAQVILFYITGQHLLPLWFIPMITLIYLSAPLLIAIDRRPIAYLAVLPPALIIATLVPRDISNIPQMYVHFFPVYVLGMLASHYNEQLLAYGKRYLGALTVAYISLLLIDVLISAGKPAGYAYVESLNLWQKLLLCMVAMTWLAHADGGTHRLFDKLATTSFGIYFVHHYVNVLAGLLIPVEVANSIPFLALYVLLLLVVVSLSLATVLSIKSVLGPKSRLLVGS